MYHTSSIDMDSITKSVGKETGIKTNILVRLNLSSWCLEESTACMLMVIHKDKKAMHLLFFYFKNGLCQSGVMLSV